MDFLASRSTVRHLLSNDPSEATSKNSSTDASPTPDPPTGSNGAVVAGILMFLLAIVAAAACLWFIKHKNARRRRRQYMAATRKASQAQEALDLEKPPTGSSSAEGGNDDEDVAMENVNQVFENPPLQLKEPSAFNVSLGDRFVSSVAHLFGSKVPLGAARVRTTTGGVDAPAEAVTVGVVEEDTAQVVVNGRIQALYDEITKQEQTKPGNYGILHEETTPDSVRRGPTRRSASFRPASELSAVSEVSLELMDREISTELSGTSYGHGPNNLDLILKRGEADGVDADSLGLGIGAGLADELADELESSLPAGAAVDGAGTEISSTGFIADKVDPNKYYSIAYTDYFLDD